MDDVTVRGITIGVSVFIALITITAVISYYSIAQETVRNIGPGTDIATNYNQSMESMLVGANAGNVLSGNQVKSILSYFYEDAATKITVKEYWMIDNDNESYAGMGQDFSNTLTAVNVRDIVLDGSTVVDNNVAHENYKKNYNKVMKELLPNSKFEVRYTSDDGVHKNIIITEKR